MFQDDVWRKIEAELSRGEMARSQGMEGRARVCARRAASAAAQAYLEGKGQFAPRGSAVDLLGSLQDQQEISDRARQAASRLLMRVDESYALPPEIDLLQEARLLINWLDGNSSAGDGRGDRNSQSGEGNV